MTAMPTIHDAAKQFPPRAPSGMSPSSYLAWRKCAHKWAFEKVLRIPTEPNPDATAGSHVHLVLEQLMGQPAEQRTEASALALHKTLLTVLGASLNRFEAGEAPEAIASDISPAELRSIFLELTQTGMTRREFYDLTTAGVKGYFRIPKADPTAVVVHATELSLNAKWDTSYGPVPVRGIIDRVDLLPTGSLRVIDYKNGKVQDYPGDDAYERQVLFYAAMVRSVYNTLPTSGALLYVRFSTPQVVTVTEAAVNDLVEDVGRVWHEIHQHMDNLTFPTTPKALCGWCEFVTHCPDGQTKVRELAEKGTGKGGLKESAPARETLELPA